MLRMRTLICGSGVGCALGAAGSLSCGLLRRILVVVVLLGGLVGAGGCASMGVGSGGAYGGASWMAVDGLAPARMHAVIDRGLGAGMRSVYAELVGGELERSREVEVLLEPSSPGVWVVTRRVLSGGASAGGRSGEVGFDRREMWRIDADGSAGIVESVNRGENVEVVFDPGLRILPSGLATGVASEQSLRMTVHPLGDRSRVRAAGGATQLVELLGSSSVPTPMGDAPALVMRTLLDASLGPSRVRNETWTWVASSSGVWGATGVVLAERRLERTTALGIQIRSSDETWVLISPVVEVVDGEIDGGGVGVGGDIEADHSEQNVIDPGGVRRVR